MNYHFRDDDDAPASLRHKDTILQYLGNPVQAPTTVDSTTYAKMKPQKKAEYNRARIMYCSGGIVLDTPQVVSARRLLSKASAWNVGTNSGGVGVMLDGDSTTGKTETLKILARSTFAQYRRARPDFARHKRIPIVYVSVPAASTAKGLVAEFADFLGLPVGTGEPMTSVKSRVVKTLNGAGTQLVLVDELQNLAGRSTGLGESVDVLKELHEKATATFVYAGIDLQTSQLFKGPKGQQLLGRFTTLDTRRLNLHDTHDRGVWRGFINRFESKLPLHDQTPGTLLTMSSYLYQRTSGSIGSLARLLTGVAIDLIDLDGAAEETITEEAMEAIALDTHADAAYEVIKAKAKPKKSTKKTLAEIAYPDEEALAS
jgi:hypothetical protein